MKKTLLITLPSFVLLASIYGWTHHRSGANAVAETAGASTTITTITKGAYLVEIMDCNFCHTPARMGPQGPEPDMSRMLSGHPAELSLSMPEIENEAWNFYGAFTNTAFAGPWGISYAANLTPDATGLKGWTEEMFVKALKTGWHMGVEQSRMIQPPMPWPAYSQATEEDLAAIFAYLQSVPAVRNTPPAYQPPSLH